MSKLVDWGRDVDGEVSRYSWPPRSDSGHKSEFCFSRRDDWPKAPTQRSGRRGIPHLATRAASASLCRCIGCRWFGKNEIYEDEILNTVAWASCPCFFGGRSTVARSPSISPKKLSRRERIFLNQRHPIHRQSEADVEWVTVVESLSVRFASSRPSAGRHFKKNPPALVEALYKFCTVLKNRFVRGGQASIFSSSPPWPFCLSER